MQILEWIRFAAGTGLMVTGLGIFLLQIFGVFKFKYVLNRMHAAAMGDTLGIGASMTGLILLQNGKSEGLSAMAGSSDTFFGMNKGRSLDAKLQKLTVVFAVVFFLLTGVLALFS